MIFAKNRPILVVSSLIAALTLSSCGEQTTGMTLVAGQERIHTDGARSLAKFALPYGLVTNNNDVMFLVDAASDTVRRINKNGAVTTLAGAAYQAGAADGVGVEASFHHPVAIAFDKKRNRLYVVDAGNNTIRMVRMNGTVTTLAGSAGLAGYADGQGSQARFSFSDLLTQPEEVSKIQVDDEGNIFVTDAVGLRKITPQGKVSTYFASATEYKDSLTNSVYPVSTTYTAPANFDIRHDSFVIDSQKNFWIPKSNGLQQITSTGDVGQLISTNASLGGSKLTMNTNGDVFAHYGSAYNSFLVKVNINNQSSNTIWQQDSINLQLAYEDLPQLSAITVDSNGDVYGTDYNNAIVRKYTKTGSTEFFTGLMPLLGSRNGPALKSSFFGAQFVTSDTSDNLYIAEFMPIVRRLNASNNRVVKIAGQVGQVGLTGVDGSKDAAVFSQIIGMAFNPRSNRIYLLDRHGNSANVRRMTTSGNVDTLNLSSPLGAYANGLTIAANTGNMYVVDGAEVKQITRAGGVSTLAGSATTTTPLDGAGKEAAFVAPSGLAIDPQNTLYTIDSGAIRKVSVKGAVTTVAGTYNQFGYQDGSFIEARFGQSSTVVGADRNGNVYILDCGSQVDFSGYFDDVDKRCFIRKADTTNQQITTTNVSIPSLANLGNIHFTSNGDAYSTFEHGVFRLNLN
jgi:sugar lactone lactonase YvrE